MSQVKVFRNGPVDLWIAPGPRGLHRELLCVAMALLPFPRLLASNVLLKYFIRQAMTTKMANRFLKDR